jgi:hypothetical protein
MRYGKEGSMIIRRTTPDDAVALRRLAALDSRRPLDGDALVAVVDGELLAAVSLTTEQAIADPFRPTADLVAMLEMRARQLSAARPDPRRSLRARVLPQRGVTADA